MHDAEIALAVLAPTAAIMTILFVLYICCENKCKTRKRRKGNSAEVPTNAPQRDGQPHSSTHDEKRASTYDIEETGREESEVIAESRRRKESSNFDTSEQNFQGEICDNDSSTLSELNDSDNEGGNRSIQDDDKVDQDNDNDHFKTEANVPLHTPLQQDSLGLQSINVESSPSEETNEVSTSYSESFSAHRNPSLNSGSNAIVHNQNDAFKRRRVYGDRSIDDDLFNSFKKPPRSSKKTNRNDGLLRREISAEANLTARNKPEKEAEKIKSHRKRTYSQPVDNSFYSNTSAHDYLQTRSIDPTQAANKYTAIIPKGTCKDERITKILPNFLNRVELSFKYGSSSFGREFVPGPECYNSPGKRVVLPCVVASRVGADVKAAFDKSGLLGNGPILLLLFHHQAKHVTPPVTRNQVFINTELFDHFTDIIDFVYKNETFHEYPHNEQAFEEFQDYFKK